MICSIFDLGDPVHLESFTGLICNSYFDLFSTLWVEFVVGSCPCSEGFSLGSPVFLPPQFQNAKFQLGLDTRMPPNEFLSAWHYVDKQMAYFPFFFFKVLQYSSARGDFQLFKLCSRSFKINIFLPRTYNVNSMIRYTLGLLLLLAPVSSCSLIKHKQQVKYM